MKVWYEINEALAIYDFSTLRINVTPCVKVDFVIAGQVFQIWSSARAEIASLITSAFECLSIINGCGKCWYLRQRLKDSSSSSRMREGLWRQKNPQQNMTPHASPCRTSLGNDTSGWNWQRHYHHLSLRCNLGALCCSVRHCLLLAKRLNEWCFTMIELSAYIRATKATLTGYWEWNLSPSRCCYAPKYYLPNWRLLFHQRAITFHNMEK